MLRHIGFAGLLSWSLLVAPATGAAAATTAPDTATMAPTELDKALAALGNNQFDTAIALVDPIIAKALATDAKSPGAECPGVAVQLLQAFMAKSDPGLVVTVDNDWCRAIFVKGFALNALKRHGEAADMLGTLVKHDKANPKAWAEYGYALVQAGQPDPALKAYQRTASLASKLPVEADRHHWRAVALRGTGYILFDRQDWDKSEKAYRESLVEEPGNPIATSELAEIARRRGS